MANDNYIHGTLNPEAVRTGADQFESNYADDGSLFERLHDALFRISKKNTFEGVTKYRAIVLTKSSGPEGDGTGSDPVGGSTNRYMFRIRIPELHSAIPDPCGIAPTMDGAGLAAQTAKYVGMHPLAMSADVAPESPTGGGSMAAPPRPQVGDIVWVEFEKAPSGGRMGSPIYVSMCSRSFQGAVEGDAEPGNQTLDQACADIEEMFANLPPGTVGGASSGIGGPNSSYTARSRPGAPTAAQTEAAEAIGCDPEVIQAIEVVESGGRANAIRFEPHLFHRKAEEFGVSAADLARVPFTRNSEVPFSRVASETNKAAFDRAFAVNGPLTVYSTSFGLYQVMGYNFSEYRSDPSGVVARFYEDPEGVSYELLIKWFDGSPQAKTAAQNKDWEELARRYNGPANVRVYAPRLGREYAAITGTTSTI